MASSESRIMTNPTAVLNVLLLLAAPLAQPLAAQALVVGDEKQLFIDHRFIESSDGITLRMNPPYQTGEPLVVADQPWEKGANIHVYCSVMKEEGPGGPRIRLWYDLITGQGRPGQGFRGLCYAESKDGIHFRKPVLGLVEKDGSRENNLVMPTDLSVMTVGGGSVARDDNPATPPEKRYRNWSKLYTLPGTRKGGNAFWYSEDGLRWQLEETLPTGLRAADTQPSWFWDPAIGRYRGYSRETHPRMVGYNESDDMTHWENFEIVVFPDARDLAPLVDFLPRRRQSRASEKAHQVETVFGPGYTVVGPLPLDFYGTGVFRYAEAQDAYFAMLPIYYHYRHMHPTTADVQLAASRDGRNFRRLGDRQSFLRLGHAGSFGSKWVWGMPRPIRMGNEIWIYYVGINWDHASRVDPEPGGRRSAVSRAVLRLDGFVSADAGYRGGWLATPLIRFSGSRLELNLDTSAGGEALVEIQDPQGRPIPGFALEDADPMNGNNVAFPVSWKGSTDVSTLAGREVRLHITFRNSKLYAFQFVR